MKRFIFVITLALCSSSTLLAQDKRTDIKSFEIVPTAPLAPVLKYQLLFDNYVARRSGNAAIFYYRALMFQNDDLDKKIDAAWEAYNKGDHTTFAKDVPLDRTTLLNELDLAARCADCDWQDPLRDFGYQTLLPEIGPLRNLERWLKLRGLQEVSEGKLDEALVTLRLGYEMSQKVGRGSVVISGLVSQAMIRDMDEVLFRLMNDSRAPNLYWTLRQFPEQRSMFQRTTALERLSAAYVIPGLAKALNHEEISPAEWNQAFGTIRSILELNQSTTRPTGPSKATTRANEDDVVRHSSGKVLLEARTQYAANHGLNKKEIGEIDPTQALGEFYFMTFVNEYDELFKLSGLPYPQLMPRAKEMETKNWESSRAKQPANVFLQTSPQLFKIALAYAYSDRQIAALMTVQAISACAAVHQNQLPAKLADIIDTPAPENPATGLPFEYKVDGDHAVLSDSVSPEPLEYTIKLRR